MLEIIQPFDGRDSGTLLQFGRVLREAGLLPAGKRGKGAPNMGLDHTANLLLGMYGAASPKDAPKAVANLRTLEALNFEGTFQDECEVLRDVMERGTFGEAIEEIILGVPELIDAALQLLRKQKTLTPDEESRWRISTAQGMGPASVNVVLYPAGAEISITQSTRILWKAEYTVNDDRFMEGAYNEALNADRRTSTEFSIRSLSAFYTAMMEGVEQGANA
jgi:hypothetical protein